MLDGPLAAGGELLPSEVTSTTLDAPPQAHLPVLQRGQ